LLSTAFGQDAAPSGETGGSKVVDVGAMDGAEGDVAFCMGKDTSGNLAAATKAFNERFPEIKAELIEFSTSADEQRAQFVQRQEAKSGERRLPLLPDRPRLRAARDVAGGVRDGRRRAASSTRAHRTRG
jgi:hypothetical protein